MKGGGEESNLLRNQQKCGPEWVDIRSSLDVKRPGKQSKVLQQIYHTAIDLTSILPDIRP